MNTINSFSDRYKRNQNLLNQNQQDKLFKSKVCIIGLGGLGGCVVEMLARIGIGNLKGYDSDTFDSTNLNRQLYSQENLLGVSKAEATSERIKLINSQIQFKFLDTLLTNKNAYDLIKGSDVVMDCLDSIETRFVLEAASKKANIPLVSGAIAGVSGQVTVIFPEDKGFELIYGGKKRSSNHGIEKELGNLCYSAFLISSIQVSQCINILLNQNNILRNQLFVADLSSNFFEIIDLI